MHACLGAFSVNSFCAPLACQPDIQAYPTCGLKQPCQRHVGRRGTLQVNITKVFDAFKHRMSCSPTKIQAKGQRHEQDELLTQFGPTPSSFRCCFVMHIDRPLLTPTKKHLRKVAESV